MFFALALTSMFGYAIHNVLIAKYARQLDGLSLAIYRNMSLIIGMSPLFFFISWADLTGLPSILHLLALGGFSGAISLIFHYRAYNYLPVGIVSAFIQVRVIFLILWAYLFLAEQVSLQILIMILIVLGACVFLGLQKHHMPHLNEKTEKGILYAFANAFFASLAVFFMSAASRQVNPLMAGYFWEILIGIFALVFGLIRQATIGKKIDKIPLKKMSSIAAIASLTTIGTGGFALAIQQGPIAIVAAVGAASIIVSTSISHFYHHEKLRIKQWLSILVLVLGVIGLKIFTPG